MTSKSNKVSLYWWSFEGFPSHLKAIISLEGVQGRGTTEKDDFVCQRLVLFHLPTQASYPTKSVILLSIHSWVIPNRMQFQQFCTFNWRQSSQLELPVCWSDQCAQMNKSQLPTCFDSHNLILNFTGTLSITNKGLLVTGDNCLNYSPLQKYHHCL